MGGWVQLSSAHDWLPSTQCCEGFSSASVFSLMSST
jgi:hypothetical protein